MARSDFIFEALSDFWNRFKEKQEVLDYWDSLISQAGNLYLQLYQIGSSNTLSGVTPTIRSEATAFLFDETTEALNVSKLTGYPFTYSINTEIISIEELTEHPDLQSDLTGVGRIYTENADYVIYTDSTLDSRVIGFAEEPLSVLHSNSIFRNENLPYRNFGYNIDFEPFLGELDTYLLQLQGLYSAYWTGPTLEKIELGANILFGFPFMGPGRVIDVKQNPDGSFRIVVDDVLGERTIQVPLTLGAPIVEPGQVVNDFQLVSSSGITSIDYVRDLQFVLDAGLDDDLIQLFFTTFLNISFSALQQAIENAGSISRFNEIFFANLETFMEKIKPEYVDFVLTVSSQDAEIFEEILTTDDEQYRLVEKNLTETAFENYSTILDDQTGTFDIDTDTIGLDDHLTIEVGTFGTGSIFLVEETFEDTWPGG